MRLPLIFFLWIFMVTTVSAQNNAGVMDKNNSLYKNFLNPPHEAKAKALWDWVDGNYSFDQIRYELQQAKDKGLGGFDIWDVSTINRDRMPAGPRFLNEESLSAITFAIDEATKLGIDIGLITSSSWNAGGTWLKPEHGVYALFDTTLAVVGPKSIQTQLGVPHVQNKKPILGVTSPIPDFPHIYKDIVTVAVNDNTKEKIDVTSKVNKQGFINWDVPAGNWTIHRLMAITTSQLLEVPSTNSIGLMLDHFSAEAQQHNLNYIFDRLHSRFTDLNNTSLKYLYVDSYEANTANWSPALPEEFKKRRGYDPVPYLILLHDSTAYPKAIAERFYFDYQRTLSDMIIDNHYTLGRKISEQHGVGYYAEAAGPGKPVHNCPFESLKSSGVLNVPRGEFWLGMDHRKDEDGNSHLDMIKGVASASHIYNQKFVEAESFTQVQMYVEDFNLLKKYVDNAFCDGLNRIVLHTFHHNPPEAGKPGYNYCFGTVFGTFQPWWHLSKGWFDYLARTSYLLQQGTFVADVLYYYGDQAPNFVKESIIRKICGPGHDFDAVNTDILLNKIEFKNGFLTLPHGQQYKVLVLAEQPEMQPEVLAKIEQLVKAGAVVIGAKPNRAHGLYNYKERDAQVKNLADQLWGKVDGKKIKENKYGSGKIISGKAVSDVLLTLGLGADFYSISHRGDSSKIRYIHRKGENHEDIFFISNQTDKPDRADLSFRVTGKAPEVWNLQTGQVTPLEIFEVSAAHTKIPFTLPSNGSCAIIFREDLGTKAFTKTVTKDGSVVFPLDNKKKAFNATEVFSAGNTLKPGAYSITYSNGKTEKKDIAKPTVVDLSKEWEVRFPFGFDAPVINKYPTLSSWTDSDKPGIKYFSGVATYKKNFELPLEVIKDRQSVVLDLGTLKDMAEVIVNGRHAGYVWAYPYTLDISTHLQAGENNITLYVANGLNNRQVGDGVEKNARPYTYSNIDRGECAWCKPWAEIPLQKAGLIGPVKITLH